MVSAPLQGFFGLDGRILEKPVGPAGLSHGLAKPDMLMQRQGFDDSAEFLRFYWFPRKFISFQ